MRTLRMRVTVMLALICAAVSPGVFARSSAGQDFVAVQGRVETVRVEQPGGGLLHVFYDLVADDASAVFTVILEVSLDGGATFGRQAQTVSGDVGAKIPPGRGKRIVWEYGKDVERLQVDRFRFRVLTEAGRARPATTTPTPTGPPTTGPARTTAAAPGSVRVTSSPPGAIVAIDGTVHAQVTPVEIAGLAPGEHRVVVSLRGHLENSRLVTVASGTMASLDVKLTPLPTEQAAKDNTGVDAPKKKRSAS